MRIDRLVKAAVTALEDIKARDIVVLDHVPNDISVVIGIITEEFQTPLSHINVLSQNRRTPNMGLKNAFNDPKLRALEGKWVKLTVNAFEWIIAEATQAEAEALTRARRPDLWAARQASTQAATGIGRKRPKNTTDG